MSAMVARLEKKYDIHLGIKLISYAKTYTNFMSFLVIFLYEVVKLNFFW